MGDAVEPRKNWIEENVIFSLEDDYKNSIGRHYEEKIIRSFYCFIYINNFFITGKYCF